jgi:nitroreductase
MTTSTDPLAPWQVREHEYPLYGGPADVLRFAVRYAVLAPSGHNTQPWLFHVEDDTLELYADRTRALPVVDPDDRELVVSCGAALRTLRVVLAHLGHGVQVSRFPDGPDAPDSDLLARLTLTGETAPRDPALAGLAAAVPRRHTNRLPFEDRPVPSTVVDALVTAAAADGAWLQVLDAEQREATAALVAEADREQMGSRSFRRELAAWVHGNHSLRWDGMRGYGFGYADLKAAVGPLVLRTFDLGAGQAARDREIALGSPVLAVLGTDGDTPADWLTAGEALQHLLLVATDAGVSASYLDQAVEVPALRERLAEVTGRGGAPQLVLRLGYGRTSVRPSPRRPVADVLVDRPPVTRPDRARDA